MRKKLFKLSLVQIICAAVVFVINYFFFHFVTDEGITLTWQPEPGKPYVAMYIGVLATLFVFGSAVSLISALIFTEKEKEN